jgi:hypothetical protein
MSNRPELTSFGDLRPTHFERFPVWASCHSFDNDEEWFDDTDEETFRPWTGPFPVDPTQGMFLARATITLRDGTAVSGFITPQVTSESLNLGTVQPQLFLPDGTSFGFWCGMLAPDERVTSRLYSALKRSALEVFPAQFVADAALARGHVSGAIEGFYSSPDLRSVQVRT